MKKYSVFKLILTLLLFSMAREIVAKENNSTLTFGVVPQYGSFTIKKNWVPVIELLEKQTGYHIILKASPSIPDFEHYLLNGKFDFAYVNPNHAIQAYDNQGYQPIVRDIKRMLQGILVVKNDSPITKVSMLNNKTLAFPSSNAFAASLLIKSELKKKYGIEFESRYVKTHSSVYLNVALGQIIAGGGISQTLASQPQAVQDKLRIIYKTKASRGHPIVIHPRVTKTIRNKLTQALISLNMTTPGRSSLNKLNIKEIGLASIQDYLLLRTPSAIQQSNIEK